MKFLQKLERIAKINIREHLKNSSLLVTSSLFAAGLGVGMSILYANVLSKETFGEYRYILGIINVFNSLSLTGMNVAVTQAVARGLDGTLKAAIRYQLRWAIPHSIVGLIAATIFFQQQNVVASACIVLMALTLPISNAFNTYTAYLQGRKEFGTFSISTVLHNLLVYSSIAVAVISTKNIVVMTFASLASALVMNIALYFWTIQRYPPQDNQDPKTLIYGRNISILWGMRLAAEQIDTFLIHRFLGPAQLATYAVITTIPERLKGFIKIAPAVALPNHANRSLQEIVPPLRKKLFLLFIGLLIASAGYAVLCPIVFRFIYPLYQNAVPLAQLYGITLIFGIWNIPLSILFSQQEQRLLSSVLAGLSIAQGIIMGAGLYLGGLMGAVIGRLAFQAIQTIGTMLSLEIAAKRQQTSASIK